MPFPNGETLMAEVVLEKVSKIYPGGVEALGDLSLCVADGELLVLMGPSGCGKTTTLRLIAGLESPTAGSIRIGGRSVEGDPPNRRDVAMVFQRPALYPHLSVRDNLLFGLAMRRPWGRPSCLPFRRGRQEGLPHVERVARLLGLTDVLERRPTELSGGQQQRVALGRALVRQPAVFLLDEPLVSLDSALRLEMRRELHLLQRRLRATMIHVTHDQDEAMALGDRVAVLDRGRLQQVDRPAVLYQRPANCFVAGALGWPPINRMDGELVADGGRLLFRHGSLALIVPAARRPDWQGLIGRPLTLGVRPEDVGPVRRPEAEGRLILEVALVERLGPVSLVTLAHGDWTVTARLSGATPWVEHTAVEVELALEQAHLFDRQTGRALAHGHSRQ
jgi:multiple sugar transport system ATP-binding protein